MFSLYNDCYSQEGVSEIFPNTTIIPPSPTAASLGKFVEMPVAHYTGTPQITVPLYEATSGKLNVPVYLSYHASGLKVEDVAGWVGTGWALNAGGVITRSMRGLPDEAINGYFEVYDEVEDIRQDNLNFPTDATMLSDFSNGVKDGEPDMFFMNCNGVSFRFFLDPSSSPVQAYTIPYKKIKIEPTITTGPNGTITAFKVTLENGDQYFFGGSGYTETTSTEIPNQIDPPDYISTWHLEKIISSSHSNQINFTYSSHLLSYNPSISYTRSDPFSSNNDECYNSPQVSESIAVVTINDAKKLSKITYADGTIDFSISSGRTDLTTGRKLDKVTLKNYSGETLTWFDFEYGQFGTASAGRLKLISVTEKSSTLTKPPYLFEYEESNVPGINSVAKLRQDHWGYHNGQPNTTLIPAMLDLPGADRETYPEYLYGGTMTRMYYPTGGYTDYEYEPHQRQYSDIVEVDVQIEQNSLEIDEDGSVEEREYKTLNISNFDLESQEVEINVILNHAFPEEESGYDYRPRVIVSEVGNPSNSTSYLTSDTYTFYMETGKSYQVELSACCYQYDRAYVNIIGTEEVEQELTDYYGGLRIKKISKYSGQFPEADLIREYTYDDVQIVNVPKYDYQQDNYVTPGILTYQCRSTVRTSQSQSSLGSSGSHVIYQTITEKYINNQDPTQNYHTTFKYSYSSDLGVRGFPFPQATNMDWQRGILLEKSDFDNANIEVNKTKNGYNNAMANTYNSRTIYGIKVGILWNGERFSPTTPGPELDLFYRSKFTIETTRQFSRWLYKEEAESIQYDPGSNTSGVTQKTTYLYDNPEHAQLTQVSTEDSEGRIRTVEYDYAEDYTDNSFHSDLLRSAHMHSQVLEQTTKVDGQTTQKISSTYKVTNGLVIPDFVDVKPTGTNEMITTTYNYDNYGNITEILGSNGIPTTYIWGYNQNLPVAQIVAASQSDVEGILGVGFNAGAGALTSSQQQTLRNGLAQAQITTYTHKPLVGTSSVTDPNDITTYYEYDDLRRLYLIRDQDQNILKKYSYHYGNSVDSDPDPDPDPDPVNSAPVISTISSQTSDVGETITFQVPASDDDQDELTYQATGLPAGLMINQSTGVISGTIISGAAVNSPYGVTITVSDGEKTDTESFIWNINASSGPFSFIFVNANGQTISGSNAVTQLVCNQADVSIQVQVNSGGNAPFNYSDDILIGGGVSKTSEVWNGNTLNLQLTRNTISIEESLIEFTITVTDSNNLSVTEPISFTVPWSEASSCP